MFTKLLGVALAFYSVLTLSCTAFFWDNPSESALADSFVGKNYDWHHDKGFLTVNQSGVVKTGFTLRPWEHGPTWTSRFGSITFNQYGREFPNGGMNEAGLVVEVLWLKQSEYEGFDFRPVLNQLTWIQYQLDNFATTEEVIRALPTYRLSPIQGEIHYFVCDTQSNCAVIEWLKGKPVATSGEALRPQLITNSSFADSVSALGQDQEESESSLSRFRRAAAFLESHPASLEESFNLLEEVKMKKLTTWQIVYDLSKKEITYRTKNNPALRSLRLNEFEYSCGGPVQVLNIDSGNSEVRGLFSDYDSSKNYEVVQDSLSEVNGAWLLAPFLNRYPETTYCAR